MVFKFTNNTLNTIKKRHIAALWTLIFVVTAFFSFLYFLIEGKTFVIAGDGEFTKKCHAWLEEKLNIRGGI